MNCRHVEQQLSNHLEGLLPWREAGAVTEHLEECPACRRLRDAFRAIGVELREWEVPPLSPDIECHTADWWIAASGAGQKGARAGERSRVSRLTLGAGLVTAIVLPVVLCTLPILGPRRVTEQLPLPPPARRLPPTTVSERGPAERTAAAPGVSNRQIPLANEEPADRARLEELPTSPGRAPWVRDPVSDGKVVRSPHTGILTAIPRGDMEYLNPVPVREARRWESARTDEKARVESQLRRNVPVRDDFVQIAFPRLVTTSDRQVAGAAEGYKQEASIVDPRLSREVTCAFKASALADLCGQLRSDTSIRLEAGASVADEKVTLFCKKLPLREVMRQLSRPFGYAWLRSGKPGEYKYELAQDLRSQLLEEELRNRDRNEALIALDREMNRFRPYLELSPDEALARARTAGPEEKKLLERYAGGGWGMIHMYFRLSPAEMTALRAGQELMYGQYNPKSKIEPQPLPADLERGILQSHRDQRLIVQEGMYHLVSAKDHPDGLPLAAVPGARAMLMLCMPQSEIGVFTLTGGPGSFISDDSPIPGNFASLSRVDMAVGESPSALDPKNALANTPLSRDPALAARFTARPEPSFRAVPTPRRGGAGGGVSPADPKVTSADVLEALHRATGRPVIGDFYTRLYPAAAVTVQDQPLYDALNQLADTMRLRWNKQDGWLQFRSASYFNDRLKEVPNRLLARWAASRRQHGLLRLDDLIEIGQLSDAQLNAESMAEGARERWGLTEWDLARNSFLRPHLRFLAGFTPEQRQMAVSPTGLPFTRLSLAQQQQFMTFLLPINSRLQSLDDLARATVSVAYTQPGWFQWEQPGQPQILPSSVRGQTQEAALQAAQRFDPQATEAQIIPTRLDLVVHYIPQEGDSSYGRTVSSSRGDSWWGTQLKDDNHVNPDK